MHKINLLQISGAALLLACFIFAANRLATADNWIPIWAPSVGVGVALCIIGTAVPSWNRRIPRE